jgi:hypothetical protein
MSEDRTKEINEPKSFEDRVFSRFDRMEIRITSLEDKQFDTKPIWERALAELIALRTDLDTGMDSLRTDLRGEFQAGMDSVRTEMKAEFASVRHEMEHGFRRVARTIDTLNQNFLEMQTYQRYVDRRLDELETEIKPS